MVVDNPLVVKWFNVTDPSSSSTVELANYITQSNHNRTKHTFEPYTLIGMNYAIQITVYPEIDPSKSDTQKASYIVVEDPLIV